MRHPTELTAALAVVKTAFDTGKISAVDIVNAVFATDPEEIVTAIPACVMVAAVAEALENHDIDAEMLTGITKHLSDHAVEQLCTERDIRLYEESDDRKAVEESELFCAVCDMLVYGNDAQVRHVLGRDYDVFVALKRK
jgi:hypothetical protein